MLALGGLVSAAVTLATGAWLHRRSRLEITASRVALRDQRGQAPIEPLVPGGSRTFLFATIDAYQLVVEPSPAALVVRRADGRDTRHPRDAR